MSTLRHLESRNPHLLGGKKHSQDFNICACVGPNVCSSVYAYIVIVISRCRYAYRHTCAHISLYAAQT